MLRSILEVDLSEIVYAFSLPMKTVTPLKFSVSIATTKIAIMSNGQSILNEESEHKFDVRLEKYSKLLFT